MKYLITTLALLGSLNATSALAFEVTTDIVVRSLYATQQVSSSFSNDKVVIAAQGDAATFVATQGKIRGAHIEAAISKIRQQYPDIRATDLELAEAILTQ